MLGGIVAFGLLAMRPADDVQIRVLSYNIRHGAGMDERVDIGRSAALIKKLNPDLVGLQEVDNNVERSGSIDQAAEIGRLAGLSPAFGSFMDYQGGQYGMGALSRFPIVATESIRLPEGNEPRVALMVHVKLGSGETMALVNVHFDWVADDGFRFKQASFLAERLKQLKMPYVLLGDFNDEPGSRTIKLFQGMAREVVKPVGDRFTFSSVKPAKEIDFVFVAPPERWGVRSMKVLDEPVVSDHRPVLAEVVLKGR